MEDPDEEPEEQLLSEAEVPEDWDDDMDAYDNDTWEGQ